MRSKIIAANWKLNKVPADVVGFFNDLSTAMWAEPVHAVIFPQAALSSHVADQVAKWSDEKGQLAWGAQNIYYERSGAFTGETSVDVVKALGGQWTLIGHSERRTLFGETDDQVHKKTKISLDQGLRAMVCVGETLAERQAGQTQQIIEKQLKGGLSGLWSDRVVIAYEPVWAIGTGMAATAEQAQEVHAAIRKFIATQSSSALASQIPILYGGSVKPENGRLFMSQPDIDGLLIGGASLKADSFAQLIAAAR